MKIENDISNSDGSSTKKIFENFDKFLSIDCSWTRCVRMRRRDVSPTRFFVPTHNTTQSNNY